MIKDLRAIRGGRYIAGLIAQGEHERQDFKFAVSDARKIARSLSAFANRSGGRLLIGVKDNGAVAGVRSEEDVFVVEQAAQMYCVPPCGLRFTAFRTEGGETVIRAEIDAADRRPVRVREADGRLRAYMRVADENIAVPELIERVWRAERDPDRPLSYDDGARTLLRTLSSSGRAMEPEELARACGVSLRSAERALVSLGAMGLVRLEVCSGRLTVSAPDDADSE